MESESVHQYGALLDALGNKYHSELRDQIIALGKRFDRDTTLLNRDLPRLISAMGERFQFDFLWPITRDLNEIRRIGASFYPEEAGEVLEHGLPRLMEQEGPEALSRFIDLLSLRPASLWACFFAALGAQPKQENEKSAQIDEAIPNKVLIDLLHHTPEINLSFTRWLAKSHEDDLRLWKKAGWSSENRAAWKGLLQELGKWPELENVEKETLSASLPKERGDGLLGLEVELWHQDATGVGVYSAAIHHEVRFLAKDLEAGLAYLGRVKNYLLTNRCYLHRGTYFTVHLNFGVLEKTLEKVKRAGIEYYNDYPSDKKIERRELLEQTLDHMICLLNPFVRNVFMPPRRFLIKRSNVKGPSDGRVEGKGCSIWRHSDLECLRVIAQAAPKMFENEYFVKPVWKLIDELYKRHADLIRPDDFFQYKPVSLQDSILEKHHRLINPYHRAAILARRELKAELPKLIAQLESKTSALSPQHLAFLKEGAERPFPPLSKQGEKEKERVFIPEI